MFPNKYSSQVLLFHNSSLFQMFLPYKPFMLTPKISNSSISKLFDVCWWLVNPAPPRMAGCDSSRQVQGFVVLHLQASGGVFHESLDRFLRSKHSKNDRPQWHLGGGNSKIF